MFLCLRVSCVNFWLNPSTGKLCISVIVKVLCRLGSQIRYLFAFEYVWQEALLSHKNIQYWGYTFISEKGFRQGDILWDLFISSPYPALPCGSLMLALWCVIHLKLTSVPWQPGPFGQGPAVQTHIITRVCCS